MGALAILKSTDMDRTVEWYSAAGFAVISRGDDPGTSWCELGRDGVVLQFLAGETPWDGEPGLTGCIYVDVADIDAALAGLCEPVLAEWGIEDRPWGAREIVLSDPDGYFVTLTQRGDG